MSKIFRALTPSSLLSFSDADLYHVPAASDLSASTGSSPSIPDYFQSPSISSTFRSSTPYSLHGSGAPGGHHDFLGHGGPPVGSGTANGAFSGDPFGPTGSGKRKKGRRPRGPDGLPLKRKSREGSTTYLWEFLLKLLQVSLNSRGSFRDGKGHFHLFGFIKCLPSGPLGGSISVDKAT